jgi:hypothetical protein
MAQRRIEKEASKELGVNKQDKNLKLQNIGTFGPFEIIPKSKEAEKTKPKG